MLGYWNVTPHPPASPADSLVALVVASSEHAPDEKTGRSPDDAETEAVTG